MRILQLIQKKQLRGAEMFASQLANQLLGLGHEVKVVALLDGEGELPFDGKIDVVGINLQSRILDYKGWKSLARLIEDYKPDIVQANAGDTLKYASISRKIFGWQSKLVFRNANKMGDFIDSFWKKSFNKWLLKEVDFVASVSKECKYDFENTFAWPNTKVSALPIGVSLQEPASHNPLKEMGWESCFPVLLNVAGFVPEKNHSGLINIFSEITKEFADAKLVLIGEGRLKESIMDQCDLSGIANSVWFAGRRNDVAAFMQGSHALVLPSLIEGLPGVILEAFANELPVVANDVGGIAEVITEGYSGYLVPKNNEPEFVNKLNRLLTLGKADMLDLKKNAKALTLSDYNNATIAVKFERAYQELLTNQ